jgi:inosine triphosphate pyrophosphatase
MPIKLITGNPNKLRELQVVFPAGLDLTAQKLDLDEIQSLDLHEIVRHKLKQAYELLQMPVLVEDVSAELENLNGLPGPFIKFFEQLMGDDSLYKLSGEGTRVTIRCTMGYFDGTKEHIVEGILNGTITAPRGKPNFGFDVVIIPDGYTQTISELGPIIKNSISHRYLAAKQMADFIATL